ncbi:MAG: glycoside hydrolase family 3 [Desulfobacterales bacterium]|nr:MAG: glycoside hydrolase family 3 [Desulfobacterales bacterium]
MVAWLPEIKKRGRSYRKQTDNLQTRQQYTQPFPTMTIEKQLGNLFITGFRGLTINTDTLLRESFASNPPGGIILFDRCLSKPEQPGNIQSPTQLKELINELTPFGNPNPLLVCIDQEGGTVARLKRTYGFQETAAPAEMGQKDQERYTALQARTTAETLAAAGINVNLAPTVDLNRNPDNPVIGALGRSFSADPERVIRHAAIWIQAHRQKRIVSCLKHFPGHGSSTADSHLGFVDISKSWDRSELIPYRKLLDQLPCGMVMVGHLYNHSCDPQYPASLSQMTIQNILREELGYEGVIVCDDIQMKAISDHFSFDEAVCRALAAGCDMVITGNNLKYKPNLHAQCVRAVIRGLDRGILDEQSLRKALARINRLKRWIRDEKNDT